MTTDIAARNYANAMADVVQTNGHVANDVDDVVDEYDDNSSSRLFERSRIKALAGADKNMWKCLLGR